MFNVHNSSPPSLVHDVVLVLEVGLGRDPGQVGHEGGAALPAVVAPVLVVVAVAVVVPVAVVVVGGEAATVVVVVVAVAGDVLEAPVVVVVVGGGGDGVGHDVGRHHVVGDDAAGAVGADEVGVGAALGEVVG